MVHESKLMERDLPGGRRLEVAEEAPARIPQLTPTPERVSDTCDASMKL